MLCVAAWNARAISIYCCIYGRISLEIGLIDAYLGLPGNVGNWRRRLTLELE
jgi:hypothetical protein